MWGREQFLVLLTALSAFGDGAHSKHINLRVGQSIDIFTKFRDLSLRMKVVPRNESEWMVREPTIDIFNDVDQYAVQPERFTTKQKQLFEGDFTIELCDNVQHLLKAYFGPFVFERLDQSWRVFTSNWSTETIASQMGINATYVLGDYYYVLVRLSRFRETVKLNKTLDEVNLSEVVAKYIDNNIRVGDVTSVFLFIKKYGSHYIDSYTTGNSLYQVFVFDKTRYLEITKRVNTQRMSLINLRGLNQYFSPWYADHMGAIKVASGNKTVENWASAKLLQSYYIVTYRSLLKANSDKIRLRHLNNMLENEAILETEMKTLAPAFKDLAKRMWFEEVLDNFLKLWETTL